MKSYRKALFPPTGEWDSRVKDIACERLQPIKSVHRNDWFEVNDRGGYFTVESHTPQVVILPIVAGSHVVMVRAKRPVLDDFPLELPAGGLSIGESAETGAARELKEETGIEIQDKSRFIPMPPLAVSPNRNPYLVYIFQVDVRQDEYLNRSPHDNEIESVDLIELSRIAGMIRDGEIYVTMPVAVLGSFLINSLL